MRVVVVGGSGHIGTYLVPRLVRAGHEVANLSRGSDVRYARASEWDEVRQVVVDREAEDRAGTFGERVLALAPDVVVDLICFTPRSARALVDALRGEVGHLVHCGSIWRHGPSIKLPISEDGAAAGPPFDEYGVAKAEIARLLAAETAAGGLVTTAIHPGHIVGPGWHPTGPLGSLDPTVWFALSAGEVVRVPGSGAETLHHVHADDLAQVFERVIDRREVAAGQDFTAVAPTALTVRGYAQIAASWFGRDAYLEPVSWEEFRRGTTAEYAIESWGHLHRSQVFSIEKARTLLGYTPRYEPEQAVLESITWLVEHDRLPTAGPLRAA